MDNKDIEKRIYDYVAENGCDEIDHWMCWELVEKTADGEVFIHVKYSNASGFIKELFIKY